MDGDFTVNLDDSIDEYIAVDQEEVTRRMMHDPGPLRELVKKLLEDGVIIRNPKFVN